MFCPLGLPVVTGNALGCRSEKQMFKSISVQEEHFFLTLQISRIQKQGFLHKEFGVKFVIATSSLPSGAKQLMRFPVRISLFSN